MKKHLMIATGLAVLSTSAFASKARINALGGTTSLLFVNDQRSAFVNPAAINMNNNYMTVETGGAGGVNPEAGIFRDAGSFKYGLYFNNKESLGTDPAAVNGVDVGQTHVQSEVNSADLFFGGDMGVQWGARVHYASVSDKDTVAGPYDADDTYSGMGLSLGMVMGDIAAYANLSLTDEYETSTSANDSTKVTNGGMQIGASYGMGNWTFFFDMDNADGEYVVTTSGTAAAADTYENKTMTIGAGHTMEISSTARMYTSIAYKSNTKTAVDASASNQTGEVKTTTTPVTVAFEADANSWLTMRAFASQSIFGGTEATDSAAPTTVNESNGTSSTNYGVGATLNFGKLKIDGIVSTPTENADAGDSDTLAVDSLMTNVSATYHF